jgi:O-acetyl-ADP-ribose deacetylase (regulator of RNase III)
MIEFVTGDILKSKAQAIAHGVAPGEHFNQGLALSLREQWPSLYKDFRHYCHTQKVEEGTLWAWKGAGGPIIYNLFTQQAAPSEESNPGSSSETYINNCLKNLTKTMKEQNIQSLAIPRLATGVGRMQWEVVKPLILKHFEGVDAKVFVYDKYQKGVQAQESL